MKKNVKRKYLFLMRTEGFGGAERWQLDYFKFIDYRKYSVTLGVDLDIFSKPIKEMNVPVEVKDLPEIIPSDRFKDKFKKYFTYFHSEKTDCIVFNQFFLNSFPLPVILAAFFAARGNVYMVAHDCPPLYPSYNSKSCFGLLPGLGLSWRLCRFFQTLMGYFTKITIAVSQASREALIKLHKFPAARVKIAYHGINVEKYVPSREIRLKRRAELAIADSDIVIVSTSMLSGVKRLDRLLEAFAILAQESKDAYLFLLGAGGELDRLTGMMSSWDEDRRRRVRFLGFQEDVTPFLQLSDIYVLSSDSEGLPLACMEAMSCGLISVVTNCGGTRELIQDGLNGYLTTMSSEGVLEGLRKAINLTSADREQLTLKSRKTIEEKFNLKKNIENGLKLLKISASINQN